mgnify:FL=1
MATYNFKNEAEVYIDAGLGKIRLDVTKDLSFSQTFTDNTYEQKTLHAQHKLHDASNITKANPANFSFTIPAITETALDTVFNLLVNFQSGTYNLSNFTLFIKLPNDVYKLENCVITNGTFIIEKLENLKLTVTGEASRLTRGNTSFNSFTGGNRTPHYMKDLSVFMGSTQLTEGVYSVSVELQNNIEWTPYETVNKALSIGNTHNVNTTMYPSNFTLKKRVLSGSVAQYVLSTFNSDVQNWKKNVSVLITAGNGLSGSSFRGFKFNLSTCSFTNRNNVGDTFSQSYDWIMNQNPTNLGSLITYN